MLLAVLVFSMSGCRELDPVDFFGASPEELFDLQHLDTFAIQAQTVPQDSVAVDEYSTNLLGIYNDPVFGLLRAEFYSQFQIPKNEFTFGAGANADSAVLVLPYVEGNAVFGDEDTRLDLFVYRIQEDLDVTERYFSNYEVAYDPLPVGQRLNVSFHEADSVLRIPLDQSLAELLVDANPSVFDTKAAFLSFFQGLAVLPEHQGLQPGEGVLGRFNPLDPNTALMVYYTNDEGAGQSASFQMTTTATGRSSARLNLITHEHGNTPVEQALADTSLLQDLIYVQPHGGVMAKITFPTLEDLVIDTATVAVQKAVLVLPVEESLSGEMPVADRLIAVLEDDEGVKYALPDQLNSSYFDASYHEGKMEYQLIITQFVQRQLSALQADPDHQIQSIYLLAPSDQPLLPTQTVLRGESSPNQPGISLEISYTQLD